MLESSDEGSLKGSGEVIHGGEKGDGGGKSWKKIKQSVNISSKINTRISSANFIGEDLKFSDDSLEGRVAVTLQLGINKIVSKRSSKYDQMKDQKKSASASASVETTHSESLPTKAPDENHNGFTFTVNGEECEFVEYYPELFAGIRTSLDIDLIEYKAVLGLNAQTTSSKLAENRPDSVLQSLVEFDKKVNASLKGALGKTENAFKNLSKRRSAQPTSTTPPSSPSPEIDTISQSKSEEESSQGVSKNNKLLAAFSGVSSKLRASINHHSEQQPARRPNEKESLSPSHILRSSSLDPSIMRSTLRFIGTKDASGKSSSWFLFSPDMRYCCKTAKSSEADLLMKILSSYAIHCESFPDTLLPHFYGLYRIRVMGHTYWFIIQGNVFASPKPISERYDVKGSTHGRAASEKEKSKGVYAIHKDLDLIQNERFLCFENQSEKDELIQILSRDVHWLESHSLMDYSFLIGFVDFNDEQQQQQQHQQGSNNNNSRNRFAIKSIPLVDERFSSAYVGLIDILTEYMFKKKIETFMTGTLRLQSGISCQPPQKYAHRLIEFIDAITIVIPQSDEGGDGGGGGGGGGGSSVLDSEKLIRVRTERKRHLEEFVERNSNPLEWIKETTSEFKETLQSELEKIRERIENKEDNEGVSRNDL